MKKPLILLAGCVAVGLTLSGCAGGQTPAGESEPLQFVLSGDANQGGGYAAMAKKYEEETGIAIEVVDMPYDDLNTKVRNSARANDLPALGRMPAIDPVWLDSTVDLKSIADAYGVNTDLSAVRDDGSVVSLPTDLTAVGLYINKTLFDAAGVSYPTTADDVWTWDEYVAAVKDVQSKTAAQYGMVMDRSTHRLNAFFFEFGSEGFNPDADGQYTADENTKEALEYFKDLNDDTFMPRSVWLSDADPNSLFKSGAVVSYLSGSWQLADFEKNITAFDWESVRLPAQEQRSSNFGSAANMVVFDGTGQEEEAVAFLDWLYSPENYTELAQISGFLPVMEGLEIEYETSNDSFQLYNEEIAASPSFVAEQKQRDLTLSIEGLILDGDPIREEVIKYLNDQQDVDSTIANITQRLTEALN